MARPVAAAHGGEIPETAHMAAHPAQVARQHAATGQQREITYGALPGDDAGFRADEGGRIELAANGHSRDTENQRQQEDDQQKRPRQARAIL